MALVCSLSGEIAQEPVVSPSGHVYEKRVILKHLEGKQEDPLTNEPLSAADLTEIKLTNPQAVKPRSLQNTSIPGLLQTFQNEWDALMLETFQLKKQLNTAREELSHALYQNDAACRVIARLMKERDQARRDVEQIRQAGGSRMDIDNSLPGLDNEAHQRLTAKSQELSAQRKTRVESPSLAKEDEIKAFKNISSHPNHKTTAPGVLCVDIHPTQQELVVTGGVDQTAVVFNRKTGKKVATIAGHSKKVNAAIFHPTETMVITASADNSVRLWTGDDYKAGTVFAQHTGEVTAISLHPSGSYLASASRDRTWAFHDIETGKSLLQLKDPEEAPVTSAMLHPDGLILATGTEGNVIRIWDLKSQKNVVTFPGHKAHITDVRFSENGFYLATAAKDNMLKLWDLRGPKNINTLKVDNSVTSLDFDYSGKYLAAAAGSEVRVFAGKNLDHVITLHDHTAPVTMVRWGRDARLLASTSMDRTLKFYQ